MVVFNGSSFTEYDAGNSPIERYSQINLRNLVFDGHNNLWIAHSEGTYIYKQGGVTGIDEPEQPSGIFSQQKVNDGDVRLYPNPVQGKARLEITLEEAGEVQWKIMDINGRVLRQSTQEAGKGRQVLQLPTSGLEPGFYLVSGQAGGQRFTMIVFVAK